MTQTSFRIGRHDIGTGAAPVFLPDIGTFFNDDTSLAVAMIDALADAGITMLKGEVLHDASICLDDDTTVTYADRDGTVQSERYRDLIERKVVPLNAYETIFAHARNRGMDIVVSVYDRKGLDFSVDIGVVAVKVATSNIVHRPLIELMAHTGLPVLVDTGDSSLEEIDRAIAWLRDAGGERIIVEHSPYPPPVPITRHDLRFMVTLGDCLGLPFGLSDHHTGEEMLYAATALGACVLEKGVCPDGLRREQDVAHSLSVSDVPRVVQGCRAIHQALGRPVRTLARTRPKKTSRMGLVAARDLAPGDQVTLESVGFAFPAVGIPVENWELVDGKHMAQRVAAGVPIGWRDVAF